MRARVVAPWKAQLRLSLMPDLLLASSLIKTSRERFAYTTLALLHNESNPFRRYLMPHSPKLLLAVVSTSHSVTLFSVATNRLVPSSSQSSPKRSLGVLSAGK